MSANALVRFQSTSELSKVIKQQADWNEEQIDLEKGKLTSIDIQNT